LAIACFTSPISDLKRDLLLGGGSFGLLNGVFAYLDKAQNKPVSMYNSIVAVPSVSASYEPTYGALRQQFI